jgi:hypothetical protein
MAIASLQASEDNRDNTDVSFQNAAQAQHAENIVTRAALQDPEVIEAIAQARKSREQEDTEAARALFKEKKEAFREQIFDLRSSGEGWGNIAKQLDVHPSFLGLGHSKINAKHNFHFRSHSRIQSEIKAATARSFKGEVAKEHNPRRSVSKRKNFAFAPAKSRDQNKSHGLALGHSKSRASGGGIGHGIGNGGGNGNGNGGANGGGHK